MSKTLVFLATPRTFFSRGSYSGTAIRRWRRTQPRVRVRARAGGPGGRCGEKCRRPYGGTFSAGFRGFVTPFFDPLFKYHLGAIWRLGESEIPHLNSPSLPTHDSPSAVTFFAPNETLSYGTYQTSSYPKFYARARADLTPPPIRAAIASSTARLPGCTARPAAPLAPLNPSDELPRPTPPPIPEAADRLASPLANQLPRPPAAPCAQVPATQPHPIRPRLRLPPAAAPSVRRPWPDNGQEPSPLLRR
jgi:hypothetical protein